MALPYLNLSPITGVSHTDLSTWITKNGLHGEPIAEEILPEISALLELEKPHGTIVIGEGLELKVRMLDETPVLFFDVEKSNALMRKSKEELEALRVYSQALNHDISTPLQNIALQTELMAIKGQDDEQVFLNCVKQIRESIFTSQNIVKDLSDFAALTLSSEERCDVNEVLMHVKRLLYDEIDNSNAAIAHGAFTDLNIQPFRLLIIFKNLIQNAIKYAGATKPQILIFESRKDNAHIITVQDNGIGIPPQDQNAIFAPYRRASNVGKIGGSGIGLSTCRSLLRGAGGEIVIESPRSGMLTQPGTAFHLEFPQDMVLGKR